jgi:hypothetical protein
VGGLMKAKAIGIGSAALLGLVASCLPAAAEPRTVMGGHGEQVSVWEQRGRVNPKGDAAASSIAYSVTDAYGTRTGTVPPTGDAARDSAPFLAKDGSGSLVLVWSRFDGVYRKIAFSRFTDGAWTNFRFLTFGPEDDDLPLFAAGQDGSFLFYVVQPNRFFYAPIDLDAGVLIGPPRAIDVAGLGRQRPRLRSPGNAPLQGVTDAPVNWRGCRDRGCSAGRILMPGAGSLQGGIDAPVVLHCAKAYAWGVGSGRGCRKQVLVIPTAEAETVMVAEFDNGRVSLLAFMSVPAQAQPRFAESLAERFLPGACH